MSARAFIFVLLLLLLVSMPIFLHVVIFSLDTHPPSNLSHEDVQRLKDLDKRLLELEKRLASSLKETNKSQKATELQAPTLDLSQIHLGCFGDAMHDRDLPNFQRGLPASTPRKCVHRCALKKFKYAGIQDGQECWCGNSFGKHGESKNCLKKCNEDFSMTCGGPFSNDVYPATLQKIVDDTAFSVPEVELKSIKSKVHCKGHDRESRTCRIQNLFYNVNTKEFMVQSENDLTISNSGISLSLGDTAHALSDLCTVTGIRSFDLKAVKHIQGNKEDARLAPGLSFFLHRFLPYNIMHVLHDDLTGLFFNMYENAQDNGKADNDWPFDLDSRIMLMDDYGSGDYRMFAEVFSDKPIMSHGELEPNTIVIFESAVIGMSRRANWYQYGFGKPQGPIPDKVVNGLDVRMMADFILRRFTIRAHRQNWPGADPLDIVIFSRTLNRRIVNENELSAALSKTYPKSSVGFVRLEDKTLWQVISILSKAKLAIGMHGSILILAMFMPRNSKLIELYPYAVPSKNYTPYRTMANLSGMQLRYSAWENRYANNTVGFPDRPRLMGGLRELPKDKQEAIIKATSVPPHPCCEDPYWLYKIFQDTIVTIPEILELTK